MTGLLLLMAFAMALVALATVPWWVIVGFLAAGVVVIGIFLLGTRGMSDGPTPPPAVGGHSLERW